MPNTLADNFLYWTCRQVLLSFKNLNLPDLFASPTHPFPCAFSRDLYHSANCRHLRRVRLQNFSDGPGCDDSPAVRHLHLHGGLLRRAPESSQEAQPLINHPPHNETVAAISWRLDVLIFIHIPLNAGI